MKIFTEYCLPPFLNQNCEMALELRSENNYSDFEFFRYLREEKDSF